MQPVDRLKESGKLNNVKVPQLDLLLLIAVEECAARTRMHAYTENHKVVR